VLDVRAVPERLDDGVGEAEVQQVLHRLLAEEMIDAKDRRFRDDLLERAVDGLRTGEIAAERLLDDHARVGCTTGTAQLRRDCSEQAGRDRQVMARPLRAVDGLAQGGKRGVVAVVAVHVLHPGFQAAQRLGVRPVAMLGQAVPHPRDHGVTGQTAPRDTHDNRGQSAAPLEILERRDDLLEGEVARDAEHHQRVGVIRVHVGLLPLRWRPASIPCAGGLGS
jgi:hypothetical protein